jgi:hypothetical protein
MHFSFMTAAHFSYGAHLGALFDRAAELLSVLSTAPADPRCAAAR